MEVCSSCCVESISVATGGCHDPRLRMMEHETAIVIACLLFAAEKKTAENRASHSCPKLLELLAPVHAMGCCGVPGNTTP
eukprot:2220338-Rhodomonas_salina.4